MYGKGFNRWCGVRHRYDVARESAAVGYVSDDGAKDQTASGRGGDGANGKAGVCQCTEGVAGSSFHTYVGFR